MRKKAFEISKSTIILVLLVSLLSGLFGATAATKLFNSNEVGYNNSESGIEADDVQGAIDELYAAATTYETLANRIAALEAHITGNSTSRLREYGIELNDTNGSTTTGGYVDFHWQGSSSDYTSRIIETANGVLNLSAVNGVKANGKNIATSDDLDNLDIGNLANYPASNIALKDCTGAVTNNGLLYKIVGKHLVLSGRIEIRVDSKKAPNPGVKITLPNSKTMRTAINGVIIAPSDTLTGNRYGEGTAISASANATYFFLWTSETHSNMTNMTGGTLVLYVPMTFIPIN